MSRRTPLVALATAAAAVACLAAGPAGAPTAAAPAGSQPSSATSSQPSGYVPGSRDDEQNARLTAQLRTALARKASAPQAVSARATVYYDDSQAPSYAQTIAQSASIWNQSERNVQLVNDPSRASLRYYEGDDPRGSYAHTDGHGSGYVLIDYSQTWRYDPLRVVAHETGHVLGLPDHYSGPCSELMSGGGPGPRCTNPYPDSQERYRVDSIWAYGFAPAAKQPAVAPRALVTTP